MIKNVDNNDYSVRTEKVSEGFRIWEIALLALCAFLEITTITVIFDFIPEEMGTAAAGLFIAVIFLIPIVKIMQKKIYSKQAIKIDERLRPVEEDEDEIEFARFKDLLENPKEIEVLEKLLRKKYIKDLLIDYDDKKVVLLSVRERLAQEEVRMVFCSNCGAQNKVKTGKICVCEFCGSELRQR